MLKYLLLLLTFTVNAADISEYEPDGPIQTLSAFGDLSGGDWVERFDGAIGAAWVDNDNGRIEFPNKICTNNGDIEGVVQSRVGHAWVVNENKDGMIEYNMDDCAIGRKMMFGLFGGGDGIEGIEVAPDGVTFYALAETSCTVYSWVDDSSTVNVTPQALFVVPDCVNAGDLAIRDNSMVIVKENRPHIVEYSMAGDFISSNDKIVFNNAEVAYFTANGFCAGGEPNELQCYTVDSEPPPPPVFETCVYSGTIEVDVNTGAFDPQTVNLDCPTVTASGTLN